MAVYNSKSFLNNPHPRPSHEIPVEDKSDEWILKNIQYIYGQYLSGQCGITPDDTERIDLLRAYAQGKQPSEQYRKRWLNEHKGKKVNEYNHINWEMVSSPMPKIVDKLIGLFISQDHNCIGKVTSEYAKEYLIKERAKQESKIKLRQLRMILDQIVGINPEEDPMLNPQYAYALRDMEELDIIMSSGSTKIPIAVAGEKVIEDAKDKSNYKHLKREAVRDLLLGVCAFREVISHNKVVWKNVDINDCIIEYSKDQHFSNSRYAGIQEWWSVEELRSKGFKEEDIKKFAETYHDYNMDRLGVSHDRRAFSLYSQVYPTTNSYGYDDHLIPVLYCTFKSDDVQYRKEVTTKRNDKALYKSKFGKLTQNTVIDSETRIYEGRWIIGTQSVFDAGVMAYIPRDKNSGVRLPIHITKLKGLSLIERCVQILDEFAMLGYKLQNALARAHGKRYTFDFTSIEAVTSHTGGKLTPYDIIDLWGQGGDMPVRSKDLDDDTPMSRPNPVVEYAGGIGIFLNELLTLKESYTKDLAEVTGISPYEIPQSDTPVGLAKLAVANMGDVLKPLYDIFLEAKERLSYNTVYRVQLLLGHANEHYGNKAALAYYTNAIGGEYTKLLAEMGKKEPMELGITFEAMPNQETKDFIKEWASRSTAPGKNGTPILSASEFLHLVDKLDTHYGIKEARMLLEYREKQDDIKARQRQLEAIEAQGQQNKEMTAMKAELDANKELVKGDQERLTQREKYALEDGKMDSQAGIDAFNKGIDMGLQQEQQQEQQQI